MLRVNTAKDLFWKFSEVEKVEQYLTTASECVKIFSLKFCNFCNVTLNGYTLLRSLVIQALMWKYFLKIVGNIRNEVEFLLNMMPINL